MTEDNEFKGRVNAMLQTMSTSMQRIENKLDESIRWQRDADRSLAAGNERFNLIDIRLDRLENNMDDMKTRDRNLGLLSVALSAVASFLGITINK